MTTTYLEYHDEKSAKFWQLVLEDSQFTVIYGKIGTAGQSKTKAFDSPDKAEEEAEKLIKQKQNKGYQQTAGSAGVTKVVPKTKSKPKSKPQESEQHSAAIYLEEELMRRAFLYAGFEQYDSEATIRACGDYPEDEIYIKDIRGKSVYCPQFGIELI